MPIEPADKSKHAINLLIDSFFITLLYYIYMIAYGIFISDDIVEPWPKIVYLFVFFFYYVLFEYNFQQTPGKIISKTKIVTLDGGKPGLKRILFRTLVRMTPFDFISYLFGLGKGQHDYFSKTVLVDEPKQPTPQQ